MFFVNLGTTDSQFYHIENYQSASNISSINIIRYTSWKLYHTIECLKGYLLEVIIK